MNSFIIFCVLFYICIKFCSADFDNLQDTCPTATRNQRQTIFLDGFPCKNPANVTDSDFKTSELNKTGDTDNFLRSSVRIVTAADFPGLNTLGLSIGRTDLELAGVVMPHSHPRASEIFFLNKGAVVVGFIDTKNVIFQKKLKVGDVFVFPRGLLHFCYNAGFEIATAYSVHNSQNPGVVSLSNAMFEPDLEEMNKLVKRLISVSELEGNSVANATLAGSSGLKNQ